jgi:hypothetical protein
MKRSWHKYIIYISLGFLVYTLIRADYLKIPVIHSDISLIFSLLFLCVGFIASSISQQNFLSKSGCAISIYQSISMIGLTVFGKYIPGKMWMALGKAAYVNARTKYELVDLSVLFIQAQVIGIWCGLLLGIIGLFINNALDYVSWIGLLVLTALTLILFSNSVKNAVEKLINRVSKKQIKIPALNILTTAKTLPWFLITWLIWGIGFYFLAASISSHKIPLSVVFCFPLACTLGILFLLAPGGVGIREGIIVGYFAAAHFDLAEAITIAAASRLWFLIGEFFIFIVGFMWDRLTANPQDYKDKHIIG